MSIQRQFSSRIRAARESYNRQKIEPMKKRLAELKAKAAALPIGQKRSDLQREIDRLDVRIVDEKLKLDAADKVSFKTIDQHYDSATFIRSNALCRRYARSHGTPHVRAVRHKDNAPPVISGYGAVFFNPNDPGSQFKLWEGAFERIMPGAFDRAIREDDVRSLFNHDPNIVLGRNRAGTLKLKVDSIGLRYEVTPPDSPAIRDLVVEPIRRGDVSGSSFMFRSTSERWTSDTHRGESIDVLEVHEVRLLELGPVVFPAYDSAYSEATGTEQMAPEADTGARYLDAKIIDERMREVERIEAEFQKKEAKEIDSRIQQINRDDSRIQKLEANLARRIRT